jgi:cytochrome oxidase assembly protein ShyY1
MLGMILLGVTNILLIVGGGLGFWMIRRRAAKDGTELAEDTAESEPERQEEPEDDG